MPLAFAPRAQFFFFFNDTATTEIYTLSLHDALPISYRQHDYDHARRAERTSYAPVLLPGLQRPARQHAFIFWTDWLSRRLHGHHRLGHTGAHLRDAGLVELL